jgi:hypothetical protein
MGLIIGKVNVVAVCGGVSIYINRAFRRCVAEFLPA